MKQMCTCVSKKYDRIHQKFAFHKEIELNKQGFYPKKIFVVSIFRWCKFIIQQQSAMYFMG
jgi:hypothetical protein